MAHGQVSQELVFVTTIYGANYLPFLAPHLYSVSRCHPGTTELVLWQDLPQHEIDLLSMGFHHCEFSRIEEPIKGSVHQRIGRKLRAWGTSCKLYPDNPLCFIDCDTLLVRPLGEFFTNDFDILFTWKDEVFPINTGVLLTRNGRIGNEFFQEWVRRVEQAITDPAALSRALAVSGAADQHTLREMIGFANYDGLFTRTVAGRDFVIKGVECRFLNETNCKPITKDTHVIHYKAGWHPIILHGARFSEHRPEGKCREMYDFWLTTATTANSTLIRDLVIHTAGKKTDRFRQVLCNYEERGILHSEMLAVCALCDEIGIEVIIESGRCRGQSTLTLARYFEDQHVQLISIELVRDENALFAEERLAHYGNVQLLYGDSRKLMPRLVGELAGKRIAVLLDGPKGQIAIDLVKTLIQQSENIVVAFFHDMRKGVPQRSIMENNFRRVFFTDDQKYVETFSELDAECQPRPGTRITMHTWRPYMKGHNRIESYGPTLAVVFPMVSEGLVGNGDEIKNLSRLTELAKAFHHTLQREGLRSALRQSMRWIAERCVG